MANNNIHKVYQLMDFFVNKYGYRTVTIPQFNKPNEVWLVKSSNAFYDVIRISPLTLDETFNDTEKIETYISTIKKSFKKEIKFLDIHICNDQVSELEKFPTVCMNTNYYSGADIESIFPGIKSSIYEVEDVEKEINERVQSINEGFKFQNKRTKNKLLKKINITRIIIGICFVVFVLKTLLEIKGYSSSAASVIVGADYKFFTLGLKQFFRLFSYSFVHASLLHLALNMYSLYVLGSMIEKIYGSEKYLLILIVSIIFGGLSHGISSGNDLVVGMSAGIYGLFAIYVIQALKNGAYRNTTFILMILLNIGLNFSSSVAWQSHFGGAIAGCIFYYMFLNDKVDYRMIILLIIVFGVLLYRYLTLGPITPLYTGTDSEIIKIYSDLGLKDYAAKLFDRIYTYYSIH